MREAPQCAMPGTAAPDVAMISPYPPAGLLHGGSSGVASYAANLCRGLVAAGLSVRVLAPYEPGEADNRYDDRGVEVLRCYPRGATSLPIAARAAMASGAPVVHVQHEMFLYGGPGAIPGLVASLAWLRRQRAVVVTLHQVVDPAGVDAGFVRMHRVAAPVALARAGIAALQAALARIPTATIVLEKSFTAFVPGSVTILHGMELPPTGPGGSTGPDDRPGQLPGRSLRVLCFGFLAPYKGLEAVLAAAELAGTAVALTIAGGEHPRLAGRDPYADQLRRRFGGVATFTGYVPDGEVHPLFASTDLVLLPYPRPFSSSGALALALAHGKPVLLSPALQASLSAGGDLGTSLVPQELAARLARLARSPVELSRLARLTDRLSAGRRWDEVAARHADLYGEVRSGNRPGRLASRAA